MTSWLIPGSDEAARYQPIDLSAVTGRLAGLEAAFSAIAKAKQGIDKTFTTVPTPQRAALLADLKAEAQQTLDRCVSEVRDGFRQLLAVADQNRQQAARDFANSPDGQQYLQGLAAFGTIASKMPPDQLATKIHSLIDAGLVGQARALSEAAALVDDGSAQRAAVAMAVQRANREAVTEAEATTAQEYAYLQHAADTFHLYTATIPGRLEDAITTGEDRYGVGTFDPAAILAPADASGAE